MLDDDEVDNDEDDDDVTLLIIGQTGKTENVPIFHKNKKLSLQGFFSIYLYFSFLASWTGTGDFYRVGQMPM